MTVVTKPDICKAKTAGPPEDSSGALRRCLASGEMRPRAEMIRFVVAPDQSVVPDLAENLPGAGLWVTASRDAVALAAKKNLFAKAAQKPAKPAADLPDQCEKLLRARCLNLMGMAKGAGLAVLGETQTEVALRERKQGLFMRAPDAGRALDNRYATPECALFARDELGAALGYAQIVYAALMPHKLTEKTARDVSRLSGMTGKSEG